MKLLKLLLPFIFVSNMVFSQQNTILIIADDVGTDYFGIYSNSIDTANTPIIRQFADNGIKFSYAWANPVCSPTRAGIFTGRYSFRTGVGGVITNQQSPQLDTAEISIPELLKYHAPVNFATGSFGKWHLHNSSPQKYLYPNQMGYDAYSGNFNGAIPDFFNYVAITNGVADTVTTYATTQTVTDAINWLDTLQNGKPFFIWLAFNAPHTPFHKPPDTLHTVPGLIGTVAHINNNPKLYFKAALEAVDSEIGRLLLFLHQNNLADSTNIIFIGDNGNDKRVAQIADTSHCKQSLYDYGVHVPMIITGPAVVNPGRVSNLLVNTTDLFITILELSGFSNWPNFIPPAFLPNDSRTLMPEILNMSGTPRDWIF
ncbi:MAG: sulfatase-like hydrolase/transferase [Bacteroidetes bacterium]|nr:sulfatase-like hydrolase/transferase [Bacteroidota bacterium]